MAMSEALIKPDALSEWKGQLALHQDYERMSEITDTASLTDAADRAKEVSELIKEVDSTRKDATKPLDDMKRQIMDQVNPITRELTAIKNAYKRKIGDYQAEQERLALAEKKRLEEEAAKKAKEAEEAAARDDIQTFEEKAQQAEDAEGRAAAVPAAMSPCTTPASYGRATGAKSWTFEITDPAALPLDYLIPNLSAIRAAAKIRPHPPEIPGVKWVPKRTVTIR
jgi:hypothetical protein